MSIIKNKIIFITGASSGIGAACARQFAAAGAHVILTARRKDRLEQLSKELQAQYSIRVLALELDVTQIDQVKTVIQNLPNEWQTIDILVNNAGLAVGKEKAQEAVLEDWETMIKTNLTGLLYVTHTILPKMVACNRGHIINIGSAAAHESYQGGSAYCASKAGVRAFSAGLKHDLLGTSVRVSEIDPGLTETEFSLVRFKGNADTAKQTYRGMTALTPEDIADTVLYCATRPPHVNIMEILLYPTDQSGVQTVFRSVE